MSGALRQLDTATLGPIRIDRSELSRKETRATELLDRHSPDDIIAGSKDERKRWIVEAMIAFANEEVRRDRELRRAP